MLKVFICEDNDEQRNAYKKAVNDTIIIENLDMSIALVTPKPQDVIEYIKNNEGAGLYFLDVDLKQELNGIALAAEIRKYDPRGFIVFITTHGEMSYLTFTFKVEALDYIVKDNPKEVKDRIRECILNANEKYSSKNSDMEVFNVKINEKIINIEFNKILFFETSTRAHKVVVHATDRHIEFNGKLSDIEGKLDDRFYRCHKSYIVNRRNIKEIDTKDRIAYMINGEECIISNRHLKGITKVK
ncbi:LytR/AlgR family response regulator transcription factor [Clostridium sp. 'White wine YQ']|uniref:LytR/AlgR family response regulator transcription factor n=1 Tax=Clostridium sp. 'White wine YQ' TaxID=3027474 RepID=UPI00236518A0|nr:LytTR family DNA-binding domain-containing protein [Clostridium sp. 'White wine YQ']MDD7795013.1 LytTR family DNA-binding domain-containing protein [Clostridium sp. 'White wine YQ']